MAGDCQRREVGFRFFVLSWIGVKEVNEQFGVLMFNLSTFSFCLFRHKARCWKKSKRGQEIPVPAPPFRKVILMETHCLCCHVNILIKATRQDCDLSLWPTATTTTQNNIQKKEEKCVSLTASEEPGLHQSFLQSITLTVPTSITCSFYGRFRRFSEW